MAGLKITRKIHAEVRASLRTMSIAKAAEKHSLSFQSVNRIRKGGRNYIGYKRALAREHTRKEPEVNVSMQFGEGEKAIDFVTPLIPTVGPPLSLRRPGLWTRLKRFTGLE